MIDEPRDWTLTGDIERRKKKAPPTVNTKPASVDESSIKDIPGVVKIVQEGSFLGVVAQTEWAAIRAAKALKVTWSAPQNKYPSTKEEVYDPSNTLARTRQQVYDSLNRLHQSVGAQ